MKHFKLLTVFCTIVFLSLSGCSLKKEAEYHAYEVGLYDSDDVGTHAADLPGSVIASHKDDNAPEVMTVTFEGKTYVGRYNDTHKDPETPYCIHKYWAEGEQISEFSNFGVNAETGELCEIALRLQNDSGRAPTEEECRKAADEFAAKYIKIDDYKVEVREIGDTPLYNFTYYIEIDGFKTSDQLVLGTDGNGKVYFFSAYNLGKFHDRPAKDSAPLNAEKLQSAVDAKLRSIYDNDSHRLVSYKINHATLIEYNGKRAIYYIIDPQVEAKASSSSVHCCLVDLLVVEE